MSEAEIWHDDGERGSDGKIRSEGEKCGDQWVRAGWRTTHSSTHSAVQMWLFVQLQLIYVYTGKRKET